MIKWRLEKQNTCATCFKNSIHEKKNKMDIDKEVPAKIQLNVVIVDNKQVSRLDDTHSRNFVMSGAP